MRTNPLVDARWLNKHLSRVSVLDASWHMPFTKRDAKEEFAMERIPSARFYDVDGVKDMESTLPHMLPKTSSFRAAMDVLDAQPNKHVVAYDSVGIFSSPRLWYTCKAMGYEHVSVLDGGLPAWKRAGYPLEFGGAHLDIDRHVSAAMEAAKKKNASMHGNEERVQERIADLEDVLMTIDDADVQYIDARSRARFLGEVAEPRPGLRCGHVPNSTNVPFDSLLRIDGTYKPIDELRKVLEDCGVDMDKRIIVGCGTGVTACVVALALELLGHVNVAVYDGSWTEWASRDDTPIVQGPDRS